jgi:hypothetical protein
MNRVTIIIASIIATLSITAAANADQPAGPWGEEDQNEWCLEHGDYSNPDRPTFPSECSAAWHPEQTHDATPVTETPVTETTHDAESPPTTDVHAAPAPRVRTQASSRSYTRAPLAATGLAELVPLAGLGLLLFGAGLDLRRRATRRRISLADLLAPYGSKGSVR